jgi:X-X-X-Leu-X-X-Gly heptad repeat protein
MRLIQRRALIVAVAVALVSSLAVLPTVASAAKSRGTPIQKLNKRVTAISKTLNVVAQNLKNVTGTVNQGIPIITQLVSGLQKASDGLTALKTALTTLSTAVQDTTTGLPGLNNARPKFATVKSDGTILGGTPGIPTTNAKTATGTYVVDFGSDVSKRALVVTPTPGAAAPIAQAVDCANATAGTCAGGDSANHVLVTTETHNPIVVTPASPVSPGDATFTVLAISG